MARVAVAALLQPERYAGKSYRPTGPALLSGRNMAAIAARVVAHPVVLLNLPFWLFCKVARQQRINPLEISGFRFYVEEMRRGLFELDGGVTTVVEDLTGMSAENFETTARRYAAMPFACQNFGNRLKAFVNFTLTPLFAGYDLDTWDRQKGFPTPPKPSLSIDDERWCEEYHHLMAGQPGPAAVVEPGSGALG